MRSSWPSAQVYDSFACLEDASPLMPTPCFEVLDEFCATFLRWLYIESYEI